MIAYLHILICQKHSKHFGREASTGLHIRKSRVQMLTLPSTIVTGFSGFLWFILINAKVMS